MSSFHTTVTPSNDSLTSAAAVETIFLHAPWSAQRLRQSRACGGAVSRRAVKTKTRKGRIINWRKKYPFSRASWIYSLDQRFSRFSGTAFISTRFRKVHQRTTTAPDCKTLQVQDRHIPNDGTTQRALCTGRGGYELWRPTCCTEIPPDHRFAWGPAHSKRPM